MDRAALTRILQRELKRVGCYHGDINGVWTDLTRQGMKAFTERANARLPVSEPDQVLLALVQNTQAKSCDRGAGSVPVSEKAATSDVEPVPIPVPAVALAGPKVSDGDSGSLGLTAKKVQQAPHRGAVAARFRDPVREHWTVSIWKKSAN